MADGGGAGIPQAVFLDSVAEFLKPVATLLADLRARGVPGVHLGMSDVNHRAYAFYTTVRLCAWPDAA